METTSMETSVRKSHIIRLKFQIFKKFIGKKVKRLRKLYFYRNTKLIEKYIIPYN
jgi:hypothetical protein